VLEQTSNPVWMVDDDGDILWANSAGAEYLTGGSNPIPGNVFDLLPPDKAQHRRLMLNAVRRSGTEVEFVDFHRNWWRVSIQPTATAGVFVFWQRDVDRQVRAEEDLRRSLSRAVTIQEDERRRISRDLHDETGQAVTGLILELRELARRVDDDELRHRADRAAEMASTLMRQMRMILHQLNPPSLKTKPLETAMSEYCAVFSERTGIRVVFEAVAPPSQLSDDQSTTLYRLLQEGLTNVARHSRATTSWVSLSAEDGEVTISVEDDGVGIDETSRGGSGLLGIRERFAMLDGHVEVESGPGRGVRIEGSIPVDMPNRRGGRS
jgi:signal transduction histidine kinase